MIRSIVPRTLDPLQMRDKTYSVPLYLMCDYLTQLNDATSLPIFQFMPFYSILLNLLLDARVFVST